MKRLAACPVCAARRGRRLIGIDDRFMRQFGVAMTIRYVFCRECSTVFANPRLDDEERRAVYGDCYWESDALVRARPGALWRLKPAFVRDRLRVAAERYHYLNGVRLLPPGRGRSFLEIGSGAGFLLTLFSEAGWRVQGVEPTPLAAFAAEAGVPTVRDFFRRDLVDARRFTVIAMMQVFEHLPDPVAFLEELAPVLAPRGLLWLEVPNLLAPRPIDLTHPHLFFYSPSSLCAVCERAGYRVLRCDQYQSRNAAFPVVHVLARRGRPHGAVRPKDRFETVRKILREALALDARKAATARLATAYDRVGLKTLAEEKSGTRGSNLPPAS